jgi:hypothetical protein
MALEKGRMYSTPMTSDATASNGSTPVHFTDSSPPSAFCSRRKRKAVAPAPEDAAVNLLLHFSRNGSPRMENIMTHHTNFAEV